MASPVQIRQAVLADVDNIVDVHTRARTSYYLTGGLSADLINDPAEQHRRHDGWRVAIQSSNKTVLIAMIGDLLVGVVAMGPPLSAEEDADKVGQLYQIHVDPGNWNNGIGGRLHAEFVLYLRATLRPTGLVEVWQRNTRAQAFYARHGWQADGSHRPGPDDTKYIYLRLDTAPRH